MLWLCWQCLGFPWGGGGEVITLHWFTALPHHLCTVEIHTISARWKATPSRHSGENPNQCNQCDFVLFCGSNLRVQMRRGSHNFTLMYCSATPSRKNSNPPFLFDYFMATFWFIYADIICNVAALIFSLFSSMWWVSGTKCLCETPVQFRIWLNVQEKLVKSGQESKPKKIMHFRVWVEASWS